ncbi:MAG: galactokinase [Acidobacteriales bacterium]|nr:galactokinase [Terriglobales bacterium]
MFGMIITQTPLRISFFGGGTDFRDFFLHEGGCVLSSAIDRYIFVILKERFDDKIRVGYTRTELVDSVDEIQHELVRECLRKSGIQRRVEVATMADIPSSGSGMGSSSAVTVGLLNAMYQYLNKPKDFETLARQACEIELDILKKPIGIQDQYISAYGGQKFISFDTDGNVSLEPLALDEETVFCLNQYLMLFYTNISRKAETVLGEQRQNIKDRLDVLRRMKELALLGKRCLLSGALDEFGRLLHESWNLKKQLASGISNGAIDEIYSAALRCGALGGKITGAGGGGFLLLCCPPERQDRVRAALRGLPELPFGLERAGTKVIFDYSRVTTRPVESIRYTHVHRTAMAVG